MGETAVNPFRLVLASFFAICLATGTAGPFGCGGSEDCNSEACANHLTATVTVPPISENWTLTVCLEAACGTGTLTPIKFETALEPNLGGAVLEQVGSQWHLKIGISVVDPQKGDYFSLKIVDPAGGVVVKEDRSVTYTSRELDSCTTCHDADFTIP